MKQYSAIVGMDLGDKYNWYCMLDGEGDVVQQGRVARTQAALGKFFGGLERALRALNGPRG